MTKKANCKKCINCTYIDKNFYNIGCRILGECNEKYMCEHYMTELDYKTALESLKLLNIKEGEKHV